MDVLSILQNRRYDIQFQCLCLLSNISSNQCGLSASINILKEYETLNTNISYF